MSDEVDYGLYDVTHPNGTDSYGAVIENMSLLGLSTNRTNFRSFGGHFTVDKVNVDTLTYTNVDTNSNIYKPFH